mgnify:CR=1 FL=1
MSRKRAVGLHLGVGESRVVALPPCVYAAVVDVPSETVLRADVLGEEGDVLVRFPPDAMKGRARLSAFSGDAASVRFENVGKRDAAFWVVFEVFDAFAEPPRAA